MSEDTKGLRITSRIDGFRRGGIAHHGTTDHPLSAFSEAQLQQLRAEPALIVQDITLPGGETDGAKKPPSQPAKKAP